MWLRIWADERGSCVADWWGVVPGDIRIPAGGEGTSEGPYNSRPYWGSREVSDDAVQGQLQWKWVHH